MGPVECEISCGQTEPHMHTHRSLANLQYNQKGYNNYNLFTIG